MKKHLGLDIGQRLRRNFQNSSQDPSEPNIIVTIHSTLKSLGIKAKIEEDNDNSNKNRNEKKIRTGASSNSSLSREISVRIMCVKEKP